MASSNPNYILKAQSPNTITLGGQGVRASTYESGGDTHIQSITHTKNQEYLTLIKKIHKCQHWYDRDFKNSQKFFRYHQSYLLDVQILSPKENYWHWMKVNSSAQPPTFTGSCPNFLSHLLLPNTLNWPAFRPLHVACHSPEPLCTAPSTQAHISAWRTPPSLLHFTSLYSSRLSPNALSYL